MKPLWPGDRTIVFDAKLFVNDFITPPSYTFRPATIVKRYGCRSKHHGIYPDLIDVIFDHRPNEISHGHFVD